MAAEHLVDDDPRYVWDADFGGELDIVDYGVGRVHLRGELSGRSRRRDPQPSIPTRATTSSRVSISVRAAHVEVAAAVSPVTPSGGSAERGGDRLEHAGGACAADVLVRGQTIIDARADLRGVFMKTTVDYSWELDAGVRSDVKVAPRVGLLAASRYSLPRRGRQPRSGQSNRLSKSKVACVSRGAPARSSCSSPESAGSTRIRSRLAPPVGRRGFRLLSRLVWTIIDEYALPESIDLARRVSRWRPS